jgi:hypothetical protein
MTTTESTETERDIVDAATRAWPALTPVIVCTEVDVCHPSTDALLRYETHTTYGMVVGHRIRNEGTDYAQRFVVIRGSDDVDQYHWVDVHESGEITAYATTFERDGVTEAYPSDALGAYESNEDAFGDLLDDLVTEGALLPVW